MNFQAMIEADKRLVYEEIDGRPIFYKGHQRILVSQLNPEDIRGSSVSQSLVISLILRHLYRFLDASVYEILTNELGLHLSKGNNLSADIAIYNKQLHPLDVYSGTYASTPPHVVIEVDLKADVNDFASPVDYYLTKTRKLLTFGVEKVIWVSTQTHTIMAAGTGEDLKPQDWHTPITILPSLTLSIGALVTEAGY
jgi:hypothetical protein